MMEKTYDLTRHEAAEAAAYLIANGIWVEVRPVHATHYAQLTTLDEWLADALVKKASEAMDARRCSIVDLAEAATRK